VMIISMNSRSSDRLGFSDAVEVWELFLVSIGFRLSRAGRKGRPGEASPELWSVRMLHQLNRWAGN
jgi:hypothetical protein